MRGRQPRATPRLPTKAVHATAHLSVKASACAPDCDTPHTKQERAVGAPHLRSELGPSTRGARCQSGVPQYHFATAMQPRSAGRGRCGHLDLEPFKAALRFRRLGRERVSAVIYVSAQGSR